MKQVCYRKIKSGAFAGDVFAIFPEYRNGEVSCFDPVGGFGSMSLEYFTDCTECATPEESAKVREMLEAREAKKLEEVSLHDFMETLFPKEEKRIFYRLPCGQYGQPSGQIEKYRMTPGEYAVEKRYEEENHLARKKSNNIGIVGTAGARPPAAPHWNFWRYNYAERY